MPDTDENTNISSVEYKKATEELYKRNLELATLYKQVDTLNRELGEVNTNLKNLIRQKESLLHLISHKVKSAFTHTKYIFAGILDGTFGDVNKEINKRAEQGLESSNVGIKTIDLVLNTANMQKGVVKYEMKKMDLKDVVLKTLSEKKHEAETKGLRIIEDIKTDSYYILGDAFWIKEAINNLIDNSIKYTKKGEITLELKKQDEKILFSIKDTGIGIMLEDQKNLFTEGGRGKDALRINVDSTGYGLYSAKLIVEAHKGRTWGESEGENKGSTFFIEFPAFKEGP